MKLQQKLRLKHRPMRPAWHFHSNYASGTLSRGYTDYLMKHGATIHKPILWLNGRKVKQVLKIKPRKKLLRLYKHNPDAAKHPGGDLGLISDAILRNKFPKPKLKIKKRLKLRHREGA